MHGLGVITCWKLSRGGCLGLWGHLVVLGIYRKASWGDSESMPLSAENGGWVLHAGKRGVHGRVLLQWEASFRIAHSGSCLLGFVELF